ncbi:hypothetical protein [Thiomicrospira sp. WB1]|uniref:hypothetical protein n=1 Tax=Thiomicrospira sp. WB1 TaxID=1685380 RepID=UPI000748CE40|nr:hypothetical protein [Thiomicrospira sp. WB1]KUJ72406.1 hypothetical protein AVO41_00900 [Thiomicrospira sp. WB1]
MPQLTQTIEPKYMNELSFTLRNAASELLRDVPLRQLLEISFAQIPESLNKHYNLSTSQWHQTSIAVILTKLSMFTLGSHLPPKALNHLQAVAAYALGLENTSAADLAEQIRKDAPILAERLDQLQKLQTRHKVSA